MASDIFNNMKRIREICDELPRDNFGYPIFKATSETFFSIMRTFIGEITVGGVIYKIKLLPTRWLTPDYDRRLLPDDVVTIISRLQNDFLRAYSEERIIRQSSTLQDKAKHNAEYYQKNKMVIRKRQNNYARALPEKYEKDMNDIYSMIVDGKSRVEIKKYIMDNLKLGERRANQLISQAALRIKESIIEERKMIKDKHHAQLMDLYKRSLAREDFRECRAILEVLNKMYGLNEVVTNKLEINAKIIKVDFGANDLLTPTTNIDYTDYTDSGEIDEQNNNDISAEKEDNE
jgi:hypothetical protein